MWFLLSYAAAWEKEQDTKPSVALEKKRVPLLYTRVLGLRRHHLD